MLFLLRRYFGKATRAGMLLFITLLSILKVFAAEEPYLNELKGTHVKADSSFTVSDEKFNNSSSWALISQHISVDNIISFEINFDTAVYFYNTPFSCTVNFKIYLYGNQSDTSQVTDSTSYSNISLTVNYDSATGKPYKGIALYKFIGSHKYRVKILSITSPQLNPILPIFRLKGQIIINRKYIFNDNSTDVTRFSKINGNQLQLRWTPSNYPGAEMFDVEYTHIDGNSQAAASITNYISGSDYTVPPDSLAKWFKNNCTRITTASSQYLINVAYDSGFVLFRIRGVQMSYPDDIRWEGNWNYYASSSQCSGSSCPTGVALFDGHEKNLNWQFSISFAEEGKRKEVISYFDGSLRNRQSVTISNTENKSIVAETVYDALGRPAGSILPAPTNDSTIHYFKSFNKNNGGNPYSFSDLLYTNCATAAAPLNNTSGTAKYYSPNNEFLNSFYYAKYIPDASGFPLAVTEYMADNTGRIKAQGGVGPTFQLGAGHETKYFYGKPTQPELDRLFGFEAGDASHYLKNMVVDPNKQISVSYTDASGKTIATALAGVTPPNVHPLPSNNAQTSVQVSADLIQPGDFVRNSADNSLTASATFLAPVTGDYHFKYRVDPLRYDKLYGPDKDSVICSDCYYDLEVVIKDACDSILQRDTAAAGTVFDTACITPAPIIDSSVVNIQSIGEYYATFTLRVSRDALNFYDSVHLVRNSDIKKLNYFLLNELKNTDFYGCYNNCQTCFDKLGTSPEFFSIFKSFYLSDSISFNQEDSIFALSLYDSLYANCQSLQSQCAASQSVCDEKLPMLKQDVSPGGQYALYDSSYNLLESPVNVLALRNQIAWFPDEFGNRDSVLLHDVNGEDSILVDVKQLSTSQFIQYWKDSWADSLVRLHPEYCNYLWCLLNSTSNEFDRDINDWLDADTAISRGWFDPVNYSALLQKDPFFNIINGEAGKGVPFYNRMQDSLRLFSRTSVRLSHSDKNILQFIDVILYCKTQPDAWDGCRPDDNCRSRNREWGLYKQLYLNLKTKFYEEAKRSDSDPVISNCTNCYIGKDLLGEILSADTSSFSCDSLKLLVTNFKNSYTDTSVNCNNAFTTYFNQHKGTAFTFLQIQTLYVKTCGKPLTVCSGYIPFTDSTCNTSCPAGIYNDFTRNNVSLYVEYGTPDRAPQNKPANYINCQFYPIYDLKSGAASNCRFFNVWVCIKDTCSGTNFSCPASSDFSTAFTTPFCNYGGPDYLSAYVIYSGPTIPQGVTVDVPVTYSGSSYWNFTAHFTAGSTNYTICSIFQVQNGGNVTKTIGTPYCSGNTGGGQNICNNGAVLTSYCPDNSLASFYKNKIRRYPEYVNSDDFINSSLGGNPQENSSQNQQAILEECHSNCEAQADSWINTLKRCTADTVKLEQLKQALIDICSKGCSLNNPYGVSSIPSTTTATYHSFEEAIAGILGASAVNDSCTAELLSNPYPYNKLPVETDRLIVETDFDICHKISLQKQAYIFSGSSGSFHQYLQNNFGSAYGLDSVELDDMLNSCSNCNGILKDDIVLPVIFDPGSSPCQHCDSLQVALNAFHAKFPTISTLSNDYEILFANFFNHRFGFSLRYDQYKSFLDSCTAKPAYAGWLCNQPAVADVTADDNSCSRELFATALTNANNIYIAYIDSVHRDFQNAWLTKCMNVQPLLNMRANLYEYHYTLYYYDQSGNLIKTVPPEGVDLLNSAEIDTVKYQRLLKNEGCYQYSDSILLNNNGQVSWVNPTGFEVNAFTAEMMINFTSHANQVIISKLRETAFFGDSIHRQSGFAVTVENNKLAVKLYGIGDSSAQQSAEAVSVRDISNLVPIGNWTQLSIQRSADTSNPISAFINGQQIALGYISNSIGKALIQTGDSLMVGAFHADSLLLPGRLRGSIKNLRIYNRLLPADEMRQNAFNVCQLPANEAGLTFWAAMNSAANNNVRDIINQSDGKLSGIIWQPFTPLVPAHRLVTTYQYNSLNQVLQQYSPDADTSQFFYDRLSRLIVSQNKEQKENASYSGSAYRFSYTQYDALGRIKEVGEKSTPSVDIRSINLLDTTAVAAWLATGVNRQLTKTIYDDPVNLYQSPNTSRKRVSASIYIENENDAEGDSTLYSYDINGNVKTLVQHIKALVAVDAGNGKKRIDYDYDLLSGKVNMVTYQPDKGDQFFYKYQYDADNRVIKSLSSRDKLIWTEDASYNYYLHGPLARMELGQYKVQGVDYAYTLQGWLKGINSDSLNAAMDMGGDGNSGTIFSRVSKDVYGFKLGYFGNDYTAIGGGALAFANKNYQPPASIENTGNSLFNGNISSTTLALSKINAGAAAGYSYGYDQLNRLTEMRQHATGASTTWSNNNIITAYRESIAYDANGNILKYLRNGTAGVQDMDSLNYKYNRDNNGDIINNQLNHVKDQVNSNNYPTDIDNQSANNYLYDRIGNLKKDVAEGINTIDWTVYGKIKNIDKNAGPDLVYGYDPGGNRTTKKISGSADTTTFYVRDATGNVLAIYSKKGTDELKWNEQHLYGSSRLGMWNADTTVPANPPVVINNAIYDNIMLGSRSYELSNHLGNVLSTISDKKIGNDSSGTVNFYTAEVLSQNDYYPFGMLMPGRKYAAGSAYRYGFNGKENDNDKKAENYDFGARIYDVRIGRWSSVDLVTKPFLNPYNYSSNDPVNYLDPNGQDNIHFYYINIRTYVDGKLISAKPTYFSVVEKNDEPNVFIHHKIELRYDGFGPSAKGSVSKQVDTQFYPDVPGQSAGLTKSYGFINDDDRKTLIKFIDDYGLSRQDVDAGGGATGYTEIGPEGAPLSDRMKKAQWWGGIFAEKTSKEEETAAEKSRANFVLTAAMIIAPELLLGELGTGGEIFYRTMSEADAAVFEATGSVPAGTETMVSPTLAYAKSMKGVTFQINTKAGTLENLMKIGVSDGSRLTKSLNLPSVQKGWKAGNAFFKAESNAAKGLAPQINVGLGNGKALETFNSSITSFKRL